MQMIALNFQASQVQSWFTIASEHGLNLSKGQIRGLYNHFKDGKFSHATTDGMAGASRNNIDSLLESMTEDPTINALWISSRKEDANALITVKTSKKRRVHDKAVMEYREKIQQNLDKTRETVVSSDVMEDVPYDSSHLKPGEETPVTHTERILSSLSLDKANRVLLSLAWMDNDALKELACFPFVLGMDETDRTNCEERPLFTMVGLTADHKLIPAMHILMPSKARWAYNWIYNEAIPYLLPIEIRRNVQLLLTDQGKELVHILSASVGPGKTFPNAINRLCAWHIVDRNYYMEAIKHMCCSKSQSVIDQKFITDICDWMYSFCTDVESKEHEQAHMQQLKLFIRQSTVTDSVKLFTEKFLLKSFAEALPKIVFYNYQYRIGGDVKVTSFVESHNASLHVSPTGPRPQHSIVTSVHRITSDTRRKRKERASNDERNADRRLTVTFSDGGDKCPIMEHAARELSPHLTEKTVDRCVQEWQSAENFIAWRDEGFQQSTDDQGNLFTESYLVSWNPTIPRKCKPVVPTWAYTRKVHKLVHCGKEFLLCNCGHHHRHGSPCRHVYSLLNRKPVVDDCAPRCMKLYWLQYGRNEELTKAVDLYLQKNKFGLSPLLSSDKVGSTSSRGSMVMEGIENYDMYLQHLHKCLSQTLVWSDSAFYDESSVAGKQSTEKNGQTETNCQTETTDTDFIVQETTGQKSPTEVPSMPVFVIPGAPVLMATPVRTDSRRTGTPLSAAAVPSKVSARGKLETLKDYKKRVRDAAMDSWMKVFKKAKTVNEYQHLIDKNNHSLQELDAKHAASDPYNTISDNMGGTLSGCVPVTQSPNQGRWKKINEAPSSSRKKLKFNNT